MTVSSLMEMPYEELLGWYNYFERRPIEWRADNRAAKIMQAQGVKEKPQNLFTSLQVIYSAPKAVYKEGQLDVESFRQSAFFQKIVRAQGGEQLLL